MVIAETEWETSASISAGRAGTTALDSPLVIYNASADPLLTPEVQEVLDGLLPLVFRQARDMPVRLEKVDVYGLLARDEIEARLVVSVWTVLPGDEALAFWGDLSDAVEVWTLSLPERLADIARDWIGLEVQWSEASAAI